MVCGWAFVISANSRTAFIRQHCKSEMFHMSLMHQSFVTTTPTHPHPLLQGRVGDSRAKVQGNYFSSAVSVQLNDRVLTLGYLPQGDFLLRRAGQRAKF